MDLFRILFPIGMIVAPLAFCVLFRPGLMRVEDPAAQEKVRRLMTWLIVGTFASVGAVIGVQLVYPFGGSFLWLLFFPLWFGLAMPLTAKKYPSLSTQGHAQAGAPRAASLERREPESVIPRAAWTALWVMWLAMTGLVVAGLATGASSISQTIAMAVIVPQPVIAGLICILGPFCTRLAMMEAEPLPEDAPEDLLTAYERHRAFKARFFYILSALLVVCVLGVAGAFAWGLEGSGLGIAGAIVGSLVGVAGGVFGTMASTRRAKINEQIARLQTA